MAFYATDATTPGESRGRSRSISHLSRTTHESSGPGALEIIGGGSADDARQTLGATELGILAMSKALSTPAAPHGQAQAPYRRLYRCRSRMTITSAIPRCGQWPSALSPTTTAGPDPGRPA